MSTKEEQKSKIEGSGRKKGTTNKVPKLLKDAILEAAERAGQTIVDARYSEPANADQRFVEQAKKEGMVHYLEHQAMENPQSFLELYLRKLFFHRPPAYMLPHQQLLHALQRHK